MGKKVHELKTWPSAFEAILRGDKTHEWRKNDRDYQVGDQLLLEEYNPAPFEHAGGYTERQVKVEVTYITENFGVPNGWCAMSIKVLQTYECEMYGEAEEKARQIGE